MTALPVPAHRLDPRVKIAWRVRLSLFLAPPAILIVGLAGSGVSVGLGPSLAITVAGVTVLGSLFAVVAVPLIRYERWRYEVRDEELRLQEGLIVVTQTVVPMVRIQHVDTSQGPVMRALGLSDVHVWTASSMKTIPALADQHAAALRDRIATLARVTDDGGL
jgi:hypothetical protein